MSIKGRFPSESATHQEHLVRPQHTNAHDTLFGGELVAWVDVAAATCAMRHSNKAVVTASIDAMHFVAPIGKGWIVNLDARVNHVSKTSCEVGVRVTATHPTTGTTHHTASAYLTFVALDDNGKPALMPKIQAETPKDQERMDAAIERRRSRLELKQVLDERSSSK